MLRRAVPGEGTCPPTLDPATLLPTGEVVHDGLPPDAMPRLAGDRAGARRTSTSSPRSRADPRSGRQPERRRPGGELEAAALRQRELRRPNGFADELRVALTRSTRGSWGALTRAARSAAARTSPTAEVESSSPRSAAALADGVAGRRPVDGGAGDGLVRRRSPGCSPPAARSELAELRAAARWMDGARCRAAASRRRMSCRSVVRGRGRPDPAPAGAANRHRAGPAPGSGPGRALGGGPRRRWLGEGAGSRIGRPAWRRPGPAELAPR